MKQAIEQEKTDKHDAAMSLLTIAIPTLNRASKVERLLQVIQEQLETSPVRDKVAVWVSDNASCDATPAAVAKFLNSRLDLKYDRQPFNLGFDGNLRFLYTHAMTPYIWFMADDDVILPGAIARIVDALEAYHPDILKFSFIQPPGSIFGGFEYPEPVHLVRDPVVAIEHATRNIKVSTFVLRCSDFGAEQWRALDEYLGDGWYHLVLSFSALEASPTPCLAAISEPLASCDDEYYKIDYAPTGILKGYRPFQHPFVMKHCPRLLQEAIEESYCQAIEWAFSGKSGVILPSKPEEYDQFILKLEWRIPTLLKRPRHLALLLALKLRLAHLWPGIRPIMQRTRILWLWHRMTQKGN